MLRRICVAESDSKGWSEVQEPLRWHREMGRRVREGKEVLETLSTIDDSLPVQIGSGLFGSVDTVRRRLKELRELGLRKVIGWFHFGNMPYASVRRSMRLMVSGHVDVQ